MAQTVTITATGTRTSTSTATQTGTAPGTYEQIYTFSGTVTSTGTAIVYYASWPHSQGNTATATTNQFASGTGIATVTRTVTSPFVGTETKTASATVTGSGTSTGTATVTVTATATTSATNAGTGTRSVTATGTATGTATQTWTATWTVQATRTITNTATSTVTNTNTVTNTLTTTNTNILTQTATQTGTTSNTSTNSGTSTTTSTGTKTTTTTNTSTGTVTNTVTSTTTSTDTSTSVDGGTVAGCLQSWQNTTCGQWCTRETQHDREGCEVFVECYRTNGTGPTSDPDGTCGVNKYSYGTVAKTIADQVYQCLACPGTSPVTSCAGVPDTAPCTDGNACTNGDRCAQGTCVPGPPLTCDDGNVCTDDSCNPATGCVFTNNTKECNDGNACTTGDKCSGGSCVGGPALPCDDGNLCTDDSCDPASGCVFTNNTVACDDSNACTDGDRCSGGSCVSGPPLNCDDGNVCTDDSCDRASGCVHTNNTDGCDDGNTCTTGDRCSGGSCVGGPALPCDDGNLCTDDSCDPATGCVFTNNTLSCDDGNPCTQGDTCNSGTCMSGPPMSCPTGYACNSSSGSCEDIDECATGAANCDANATCANTAGGFTCTCNPGYQGNGTTCTYFCTPTTVGTGQQRCIAARQDGSVELYRSPTGADDCHELAICGTDVTCYNRKNTNCYKQQWLQVPDEPDVNWCGPTAGKNLLYWYGLDVDYPVLGDPMDTNTWDTADLIGLCLLACNIDPTCEIACNSLAYFIAAPILKAGTLPGDLERTLDTHLPDGYVRCRETRALTLDSLRWSLSYGNPVIFTESREQWNLHWAAVTGLYYDASNELMLRIANSSPDVNWDDFESDLSIEKVCNGTGCSVVKWFIHGVVGFNTHVYRWAKVGETSDAMGCADPYVRLSSVSAGDGFNCGLLSDGSAVACWGSNSAGQLGLTPYHEVPGGEYQGTAYSITPVPIPGTGSATAIATGGGHACVLTSNGAVYCWGSNSAGQLGLTPYHEIPGGEHQGTAYSITPVLIAGLDETFAIAAGEAYTCALTASGVYCWGSNSAGQLGLTPYHEIPGGEHQGTAYSITPVPIPGTVSTIALATGSEHACVWERTNIPVYCWGSNSAGQLGLTPYHEVPGGEYQGTPYSIYPVPIAGLDETFAIAAGEAYTCALTASGVYCWGSNSAGQLGLTPYHEIPGGEHQGTPYSITPVPIPGTVSTIALATGSEHACVWERTNIPVYCWGSNSAGQLGLTPYHEVPGGEYQGTPYSIYPVAIPGLPGDTVTAITSGGGHTCALRSDHGVSCWGSNGAGQLGLTPYHEISGGEYQGTPYSITPVLIPGPSPAQ